MHTCIARHGDAHTFLARARSWLLQTEPENSLILGIAQRALEDTAPVYAATVEHDGAVVGCALRTPPRKLVMTRMPPASVSALAVDVAACYDGLPGVTGPPAAAREFALQWCERHDCRPRDAMALRIYRLEHVRHPAQRPAGELRLATATDVGLIASWVACFAAEAHTDVTQSREFVAQRIAAGEMALWWDDQPRSLAGYSGRSPNGVRIGYVYTPPEWRRRGYAAAAVAALSQHALDHGARFCCLYTDLSNPTSNMIYQRIGYEPVADAVDIQFNAR